MSEPQSTVTSAPQRTTALNTSTSCLFTGVVYHKRTHPREHRFLHNVFCIGMDIDRLPQAQNRFFSINTINLLSFYESDHGALDARKIFKSRNLRRWIQDIHDQAQIDFTPNSIHLVCYPRLLGYVFNPISLWYNYNSKNQLITVLAEVNNTFGETHNYLIYNPDLSPIHRSQVFTSDKVFHVSPFFKVEGVYHFRITGDPLNLGYNQRCRFDIAYFLNKTDTEPALVAWTDLKAHELNSRSALSVFLSYPLMTLKVIFLIHFHALILWFKKAQFSKKPEPPKITTT